MEWIIPFVAIFGALGVLWALRDYFTGGGITDDTPPEDTEAERERLRTNDQFRQ